jgi:ribose 5-phosphate isomerase B
MSKVIAIAADHGGFELKEFLKEKLKDKITLNDFGTSSNDSVDYPDYAHIVASKIENKEADFGILICGSGNGINMAANKHTSIRSALCWNSEIAKLARLHNDANIIALPGRFIDFEEALKSVEIFLATDFEGGRHSNRINKIPC